jgi:hypothetical protein
MPTKFRQSWQLSRVRDGDGTPLAPYRFWHLFSRSVFHLDLDEHDGPHHYTLDLRLAADPRSAKEHEAGTGKPPAALYRDGRQLYRANLPTTFPVPGGVVEVATSMAGVRRAAYVATDGAERHLEPDPRSTEGRRARFDENHPGAGTTLGVVSLVVLLVALVLAVLQGIESVTAIPPVAERVGTFDSPVDLPGWANGIMLGAAIAAGIERATRMRYHWLIDSVAS